MFVDAQPRAATWTLASAFSSAADAAAAAIKDLAQATTWSRLV
eukprot:COSAG03_NODE_21800_length_299_cov_0.770000_1_plen_42_part_01